MGNQKTAAKRTKKHPSTRTGRPKTQAAPSSPPATPPTSRPRPKATYRDAPLLIGPGQPAEKRQEEVQEWVYPTENDYTLHYDIDGRLEMIPEVSEDADELYEDKVEDSSE